MFNRTSLCELLLSNWGLYIVTFGQYLSVSQSMQGPMTKHTVLYYDISKFSLIHCVGGKEVTFKSPMLLVLIAISPEYVQISHHFGTPLTIVLSQLPAKDWRNRLRNM